MTGNINDAQELNLKFPLQLALIKQTATDALSLHCLLIQEPSFTTQYYKSCESRPLARFLISIIFMFCTFVSFHLCEPPQTCLPRHEVSTFFFKSP